MPRSDKPISTGSLTDPVASSRSRTWSSHADVEDADHFEPDGVSLVDPLTQEPVETVVNLMDAQAPTVAIRKLNPTVRQLEPILVHEWTTVRSIEGRTYTRVDERHEVSDTE